MANKVVKEKEKINRIKVVLAERDITYKALAEMVDKTPSSISRICNNDFQPTLGLLRKIARVLKVDIRELLIPTND
jgi:putative transcriptional regulator